MNEIADGNRMVPPIPSKAPLHFEKFAIEESKEQSPVISKSLDFEGSKYTLADILLPLATHLDKKGMMIRDFIR